VAEGVRDHEGIGIDGTGFRFPADLDPWEEPLDGVEVYCPLGDVLVSLPAFERLMARFLHAIVASVTGTQAPAAREPWWPAFMAIAGQIEQRAASQASSAPTRHTPTREERVLVGASRGGDKRGRRHESE